MKERNGAVDQKKGHHGIDRFGVPGKEFAERGAKHCPYKTTGGSDQREYDGEPGQGQRCLVYGQYVQGHRRDRIDIDFRIRELEHHTREEAGFLSASGLQVGGAFPDFPGQIQHVGRAQYLHDEFHFWKQRIERCAEGRAEEHNRCKTGHNPKEKAEAPPETQPDGIAHREEVIRSRRVGGDKTVN